MRLLSGVVALAGLLLLAGCRGERKAPVAEPCNPLPVEAERPAEGFQAVAEDVMTTGTRLRLRWVGGMPKPSDEPATIGLCLPAGEKITARWLGGTIQGQPIRIMKPGLSTTETQSGRVLPEKAEPVEYVGLMRHWPIYKLRPAREFFDMMQRSGAADAPQLEATLEVKWQNPVSLKPTTATLSKAEESWEHVVRGLVLNGASVGRFRVETPALAREVSEKITDPRRLAPGSRPWARLDVTSAGLTRLDPDDLLKAGFPAAGLQAGTVRIYSHGKAVPLLLAPGAGAPAGMKPGVYFYAQGGSGPYSATRTYWATVGEELPASRLAPLAQELKAEACRSLEVVRRTAVRNEDTTWVTRQNNFLAIEGMDWVEMPLADRKPVAVTLALPDYLPDGKPLPAEVDFFLTRDGGLSAFKIEVISDREVLANFSFITVTDGKKKINIPPHCVKDGKVTLALRLVSDAAPASGEEPGSGSGFWFDRFQVTYPAATRLQRGLLTLASDGATTQPLFTPLAELGGTTSTTASAPAPLVALKMNAGGEPGGMLAAVSDARGRRGLAYRLKTGERVEVCDARAAQEAPSPDPVQFDDLAGEEQGADMLIIAHRDFMRQAAELKKFHEGEGWRVRLVDVQSVYDTFSDGELSPLALKSFLGYTLRHWRGGAPGQVLLVGDCTSDYLNVTRTDVRNWVPTYTYNRGGESWASDYWFTTVAGNDNLGDVMLGRISVASEKDATTVVRKAIDYGGTVKPGPWRGRLAFVADDGEFPEYVEDLRKNETPDHYEVERVYLNELPLEDNWYLPKNYVERKRMKVSRAATQRILETFRKGVSFLTYYGHGSPNIWTDERIWFGGDSINSDNQRLAGCGYCTFVANMTCNSGAIDYPLPHWNICITEDMMRIENGGAIACFVPSGPGVTAIHKEMSKALGHAIFEKGLRRFGELTMLAKAQYALQGNSDDMLYMYHLLGDPALGLQLAEHRGRITPSPAALTPGSTPEWTLTGVTPAAGLWTGALVGEDGHTIWASTSSTAYQDGRIALKVAIPKETRAETDAALRVYAWDPQSGQDLAVAGRLAIQRPQLTLERVAAAGPARVTVDVSNPGKVKATAELALTVYDAVSSRSLGSETVTVEPKAPLKKEFTIPEGLKLRGPVVAEVSLRLPEPPDEPSRPQVLRQRVLLTKPDEWLGLALPLCGLDERATESAVLRVSAAVPKGSGEWAAALRYAGDTRVTSQPLQADPGMVAIAAPAARNDKATTGLLSATFTLDRVQFDRAVRLGSVELRPANAAKKTSYTLPAAVPITRLERRRAQLRFVPGSIKPRPAHPTDGDTVFVDLEVENAGNMESDPASLELLTTPPEKGSEPANDQMQNGPRQIIPLAPGRRIPMTLRWDPSNNAGRHTIYAHLRLVTALDNTKDLLAPVTVEALTKASLELGTTEVVVAPRAMEEHHVTLRAVVKNTGQADAHNVMVSFYRSGSPIEENKLGEREVPMVPGGGSVEVTLVWNFDPLRDMVRGTQLPQPTVQIWLKGSTQRISHIGEERR